MVEERDQVVEEEDAAVEGTAAPALEEVEGEDPAAAVEHDLDELAAVARERDEYLLLAQRTQADFENFRKRKAREVSEAERRGMTKLAKELLPAVDNLELAVAQLPEDAKKGVTLVHDEVVAALARVGIEGFSPEGERFDPTEHEAMASHPVAGAVSGTVAEVYQRGYRLNGGVLRPARVVVAE
ncbi:MAG: nucleotide exchange factor GrpE [Solirubrobacteraceae bacterium]